MLSLRTRRIALSPTLRINALAGELRAAGVDVLDFSAGQPDFPTPEAAKRAGVRAIETDQTRYTANSGLLELRQGIAAVLREERGLEYRPEDVLVSTGAKASLYFACMALLDPGDEVLIPSPYWVSYPEQVRLTEAEPVFVDAPESAGFKVDVERLAAATTERTKVLLLNYPSNPTGACYDRAELEPIADFCASRNLWIIADEIYSRLLFDDRAFTSIAALGPETQSRTIVIDGMSKAYSMTGWRIGYAAGPSETIAGMSRIQSHCTSNAASISQWASIEALRTPAGELRRRTEEFQTRRDEVVERLNAIRGVSCVVPGGSFYVFPNFSGCFGRTASGERIDGGDDLARYLLETARVAVVPGEAFGAPGHIRISYAVSRERVREGMQRIAEAIDKLQPD